MRYRSLIGGIMVAMVICVASLETIWGQDPIQLAPDIYRTIFENERIRVNEITFKQGAQIDWHQHPDHVVYWLEGGTLRVWNKGADSVDVTGKAGDVLWLPAVTHKGTNIGKSNIRLVQVELKEPAPVKATDMNKK